MTQHKDDKQTIEQPQKQKKPNGWFKPFVSGVVGGTLALGVYVLTPYAQHSSDSTANDSAAKTEAVSTSHTNSSKQQPSKHQIHQAASPAWWKMYHQLLSALQTTKRKLKQTRALAISVRLSMNHSKTTAVKRKKPVQAQESFSKIRQ